MGAAASVNQLYSEAFQWFKKYFDTEMYIYDFKVIDKDRNGGITFSELRRWIKRRAIEATDPFKLLISHIEVIKMAHAMSAKVIPSKDEVIPQSIVTELGFRKLLINLFTISIIWVHFKNADEWVEGCDAGNMSLTLDEFRLACKSFSAAMAGEELTDEQIKADFEQLDTNKNGSLTFREVCEHCGTYFDKYLSLTHTATAPASRSPSTTSTPRCSSTADFSSNNVPLRSSLATCGDKDGIAAAVGNPMMKGGGAVPGPSDVAQPAYQKAAISDPVINSKSRSTDPESVIDSANDDPALCSSVVVRTDVSLDYNCKSPDEKTAIALSSLEQEVAKNKKIADFVEVKFNTEKLLCGN